MDRKTDIELTKIIEYAQSLESELTRMKKELARFSTNETLLNEKLKLSQKSIFFLIEEKKNLFKALEKSKKKRIMFQFKFAEACQIDQNIKNRLLSIDQFWVDNQSLFDFAGDQKKSQNFMESKKKESENCDNCKKISLAFLSFEQEVLKEFSEIQKEIAKITPEVTFLRIKTALYETQDKNVERPLKKDMVLINSDTSRFSKDDRLINEILSKNNQNVINLDRRSEYA